jgi:uncharacterized phiE125 gp8 family phage protein
MATRLEPKRPIEVIDYQADWSEFLGADDTIANSVVTAEGVTVSDTNDDTTATITIGGGTNDTLAKVTNTITTAGGRVESEIFSIYVSNFAEPVSVPELREAVNLWEDTTRDAKLAALGRAAREHCEKVTGHILVRRQFAIDATSFQALRITKRPLISVDELSYDDADGEEAAFEDFRVQGRAFPAYIVPIEGASFPAIWSDGGATLVFTAGYGEGEVPEPFVQAIKILVAFWFDYPDGIVDGKAVDVPFAVKSLLGQFDQPMFA